MLNTERLCIGCMSDNNGEAVCSICGYDAATPNPQDCLPARLTLHNRYLTGRVLSVGASQITYIGWDTATDTAVNINEYFPNGVAQRNADCTVSSDPENKYAFNEGLLEFLNIADTVSSNELAAIVPVTAFFEENGTAYSVSPVIQSITLEDFLNRNSGSLKWEQARPLFLPLIDTLAELHRLGLMHGGISPDTIIVGRDGKLRFSELTISGIRGGHSEFETELYDGYAPIEQYGDDKSKIGEAADVYALSAVLFRVLIGIVPPHAKSRQQSDSLSIPAHFAEELPRQVLVSLANGMQITTQKRTATVESLKNELVYGETAENARIANAKIRVAEGTVVSQNSNKKKKRGSSAKYAVISAFVTATVFIAIAAIVIFMFKDKIFTPTDVPYNTESDYVTTDSGPQLGDYNSEVVNSVNLYNVPDLLGKYYSQIEDIEEYDKFKFTIAGKAYSDKYPRGAICAQSISAGTGVVKETTISLTISLGAQEFKIANVVGLTEEEAKIELLKQGFLYDNIIVDEAYDSSSKSGVVLEQTPESGSKTNAETVVRIYINTYTEEEENSDTID